MSHSQVGSRPRLPHKHRASSEASPVTLEPLVGWQDYANWGALTEPGPAVSATAMVEPIAPLVAPTATRWRRRYSRWLIATDLIVLLIVVFGAQMIWFGSGNAQVAIREDSRLSEFSYWIFSLLLVLSWLWALSLADSRSERVIGTGSAEYARIVGASLRLFGLIAILAFLLRIDVARGFLVISLPAGVLLLLAERWVWRKWLLANRRSGRYSARVLLVGSRSSVAQIAKELARTPGAGYRVIGACVPDGQRYETIIGTDLPIIGPLDAVEHALALTGADTVAITSTDELPPDRVKQISWGLEAGRQHLVLAPSMVDIAGPRLHMRPVAGLPLIHVETPRFTKGQAFGKRSLDLVAATLGVIFLSPVLAGLAIAVRRSGPGPVLFRQTRIGHSGHQFQMLKFRSMVQDAEDLLPALAAQRAAAQHDAGNDIMFKMKNDPRITPIGRIMRKFSLDELPQLFNVIAGSMSLVGPRPPLPSEVAQYAAHVHRRFLAKPGITGLWQVSGRSTLSWEDSVRLDLSYVDNWTMLGDVIILLKTARATIAPGDTAH